MRCRPLSRDVGRFDSAVSKVKCRRRCRPALHPAGRVSSSPPATWIAATHRLAPIRSAMRPPALPVSGPLLSGACGGIPSSPQAFRFQHACFLKCFGTKSQEMLCLAHAHGCRRDLSSLVVVVEGCLAHVIGKPRRFDAVPCRCKGFGQMLSMYR